MAVPAGLGGAGARARGPALVAAVFLALRPKQWLKNLLLFAAPAAAGGLTHGAILGRTATAFVAFCAASSALYLVNDAVDVGSDRLHPVKCRRPIASGRMSIRLALVVAGVLLVGAEAIGFWLGYRFLGLLTLYIVMVLAYSLRLKRIPVVDALVVAAGFVLRAIAGGWATGIDVSEWFLLLVSLGALFVVTGKRYADLQVTRDAGARGGGVPRYNRAFLLSAAMGLAIASVAVYVVWVFVAPTHSLGWLTLLSAVPFAAAMARYAFLVAARKGGAPEDLFVRDRTLQLTVLAWLLLYGGGVYAGL